MKTLFLAASLIFTLSVSPAFAQQGPAGVPGVFGLVDEVLPASAKKPTPHHHTRDCQTTAGVRQCVSESKPSPEVLKACAGKKGKKRQQCLTHQTKIEGCKSAPEPGSCQRFLRAHEVCGNKLSAEHRQCLFDILIPKK